MSIIDRNDMTLAVVLNPNTTNQQPTRLLTTLKKVFGNIIRKEENAGNQYFLLFSQCFLDYLSQNKFHFFSHADFVVCKCFQFEQVQKFVELQESMDRCTGCRYITEILLKMELNTIQSIN